MDHSHLVSINSQVLPTENHLTSSIQQSIQHEQSIKERARRWRLALGTGSALQQRAKKSPKDSSKTSRAWSSLDHHLDKLFAQIYGRGRRGLEQSNALPMQLLKRLNPRALDALDELDNLLPHDIAEVMRDELTHRLDPKALLNACESGLDVPVSYALLENLVRQSEIFTDKERQRARELVKPLIDELKELFKQRVQNTFGEELSSESVPSHTRYLPPHELDWPKTILANLKHYQVEEGFLIPERLIRRQRRNERDSDLIICLDHSGSMASSVIHASIYAAVLASVPGLNTRVIMFNHEVCDLSARDIEPIDMIFAARPFGGTDLIKALNYCQSQIERPEKTTLIFISDLIDGASISSLTASVSSIKDLGTEMIFLLALSDDGHSMFSDEAAQALAQLGTPAFCCTPDRFPQLIRDSMR